MNNTNSHDLEIKAFKKFTSHGLKIRNLFTEIANKNPSDNNILLSNGMFKSKISDYMIKHETAGENDEKVVHLLAIQQAEIELFTQGSQHIQSCLLRLQKQVSDDLAKYKKKIEKKPQYYLGGKYPSSQTISNNIDNLTAKIPNLFAVGFSNISNNIDGWDAHFNQYYSIVEDYIKLISKMENLFIEDQKSRIDLTGIKLRVVAISIAIIAIFVTVMVTTDKNHQLTKTPSTTDQSLIH